MMMTHINPLNAKVVHHTHTSESNLGLAQPCVREPYFSSFNATIRDKDTEAPIHLRKNAEVYHFYARTANPIEYFVLHSFRSFAVHVVTP